MSKKTINPKYPEGDGCPVCGNKMDLLHDLDKYTEYECPICGNSVTE